MMEDGIVTPHMFGAVADFNGTTGTDDGAAFNRMFLYIDTLSVNLPKVVINPGRYLINTTVDLPYNVNTAYLHLEISGYGATIHTRQPITVFRRWKSDLNASTVMAKYNATIKGLHFQGNSSPSVIQAGQRAMHIAACYTWSFQDMQFDSFDTALTFEFMLGCTFDRLRFTNNTTTGMVGRHGSYTGATVSNSAFNANSIRNCRWFNASGSYTSLEIIAGDQNHIQNCISEGSNPQFNFVFDYFGSTTVNSNTYENIWIESVGGTITSNTIFKLGFKGQMYLKNIQRTYPNRFFDLTGWAAAAQLYIDGITYLSNLPITQTLFHPGGDFNSTSGKRIYFKNIPTATGSIIRDTANWEGGFLPWNIEIEEVKGANAGTNIFTKGAYSIEADGGLNFYGRYSQAAAANRFMGFYGSLNFPEDNTYNIGGNSTTNLRPARVSANRFLADVNSTYGFAFGDNAANPVEYITRPLTGVIRLTAQAMDLPLGTTAERPAALARRFRYNTTLNTIEWYNGTAWVQPVTTVPDGSETKITAGANVTVTGTGTIASPYVINASGTGGSSPVIRTVTANANFLTSDYTLLVDTSAGNVAITIDNLSSGQLCNIKKITNDVNIVTITPTSGTIDGGTNYILDGFNESIMMQRDATNYYILNK